MARTTQIMHKRGATFSYAGLVYLPAGIWTAAAKVEKPDGTLVETLAVTLTPPVQPETAHMLLLVASASATALWPVLVLLCDIVFSDANGVVIKSRTFFINVEKGVTND